MAKENGGEVLCVECGASYLRHSDQANDVKLDPRASGERCPTSPNVRSGPYWTDPDVWGYVHHARCACKACEAGRAPLSARAKLIVKDVILTLREAGFFLDESAPSHRQVMEAAGRAVDARLKQWKVRGHGA